MVSRVLHECYHFKHEKISTIHQIHVSLKILMCAGQVSLKRLKTLRTIPHTLSRGAKAKDLLILHFGSVHLVSLHRYVALLRHTVVQDHLLHQHLQLMDLLPRLDDKMARVTGHGHIHIHVFPWLWQVDWRGQFLQRERAGVVQHGLSDDLWVALSETLSRAAWCRCAAIPAARWADCTGHGTQKHILLMLPQVCICDLPVNAAMRIREVLRSK